MSLRKQIVNIFLKFENEYGEVEDFTSEVLAVFRERAEKMRKDDIVGIKNGEYTDIKSAEIGGFNAALDTLLSDLN